ncbi:MAG TPA: hypothetical protein VHT30_04045 [Acidimicrobiales bacterium]|jgi:hypothetical protein|nr:hypothetical protein [Acidimicrobiales bacterium]
MNRFRKRGVALLGAAVLTGFTVGVIPAAASAAPRSLAAQGTPFGQAGFVSYGTGSELDLSAVSGGGSTLANVDQAFSGVTAAGGTVGSGAVTSPITGAVVQPAGVPSGINATARGSGLEVGLGLTTAQANQIKLGIAESESPPPSSDGTLAGPAVATVPVSIPGVIQTGILHGFTATSYNSSFCPVGQPLAFGLGSAAAPTSVLGTTVASPGAAASSTQTGLVANTDGTFGLETKVAETIAPLQVSLPTNPATTITVTVQGTSPTSPVTLTAFTDGEGHSTVALGNADPTVTVAISLLGAAPLTITASLAGLANALNPLLGTTGTVSTVLKGLGITLSLNIGNGTTITSPIPTFSNGTNAISGAYDLLALHAALGTTTLADLRLGHMEAAAALPNGSISCSVPVAKVANPANVTAPGTFTWTILIPSSTAALNDSTCDLINIKATDKISRFSGSPTFTVGTISNGGVYDSSTGTITWSNLGTYHPGDPPIALTVNMSVPADSGAGVLQDTANVSAGLGNCTGGVTGETSLIGPNLSSVVVSGSITLRAPSVAGAAGTNNTMPVTGTGPTLAWVSAGLLILAFGTRRVLRKVRGNS